ncbi:hypothetical protein BDQ94DRAFT_136719 [Aspergillus welwitschiae]|uniref:Uncharacterized protein n=1 Tax=Aspergillus welwitschiae TaxID=1341132 RepID=A0A3F3QET7_9EURO|nr:hypothetical protein BDQ94DRAFT_136719 [Aspergillus welwitschiae]RDH37605.1 hypothetical protein BDQ94DRAFT_136719 [Aspergillus welwitschiae]
MRKQQRLNRRKHPQDAVSYLLRQPHHVAISTVACFASNVPSDVSHLNVDRLAV